MFDKQMMESYSFLTKAELIKWIKRLLVEMVNYFPELEEEQNLVTLIFDNYENGSLSIGSARVEAFKMHEKARNSNSLESKLIYRVYGQALSTIHVKTHAFHAANYLLKLYHTKEMDIKALFQEQTEKLNEYKGKAN